MEECELLEMKPVTYARDDSIIEERIDAGFGPILVAQQGVRFKSGSARCCIVTFHDLGLNYLSNFQSFFNYHLMVPVIKKSMPVFHINAPGQEDDADDLPESYTYPTISQLAESVRTVCNYYGIKQAICFGVGLGANVMARVALNNPDLVDGLFMINPVPTAAGWIEWGYQKRNIYYLRNLHSGLSQLSSAEKDGGSFPQCVIEYLLWHHFGTSIDRNLDLMNIYRSFFSCQKINPKNLAMLIESYLKRDDVGIYRETNEVSCSSLILCGNDSPYLEDSINMNQRLRADRSTWMKLFDCGQPLDEQPGKVSEAFILFAQGLGLGLLTCYKYKNLT